LTPTMEDIRDQNTRIGGLKHETCVDSRWAIKTTTIKGSQVDSRQFEDVAKWSESLWTTKAVC
jgi:hypothetical protein